MVFCPNINGILAHWKQSFLENVLQHQDVQFLRLHVKVTCGQRRATVLLFVGFWWANIPTRCKVQGSYAYCSGMHWHCFFKTFFCVFFHVDWDIFQNDSIKSPLKTSQFILHIFRSLNLAWTMICIDYLLCLTTHWNE